MIMKSKTLTRFEAIYQDNKNLIYTYIYDYVDEKEIADEIFQLVAVKIYENMDKFSGKESRDIRNYLRAMTRNTVSDYFRVQKKHEELVGNLIHIYKDTHYENNPIEDMFSDQMEEFLEKARETLDEEDKHLLMLKYEERLSSKEIGELYGKSDAYIRVRLRRIREKLKELILAQKER